MASEAAAHASADPEHLTLIIMTFPNFPKRLLAPLLALCFSAGLALALWHPTTAIAQTETTDLFYRFNGEPIPLVLQENAIAVAFQDQPPSRFLTSTPLYQQLQEDLNAATTRGDRTITVQPVGSRYAIATLPPGSRSGLGSLRPRLRLPYVESTLAVLNRPGEPEAILLPNEIIVSFAPDMSPVEQSQTLAAQGLELIRPLRFTRNRVLARLHTLPQETAVLTAAEQLNQVAGVRSATPNFISVRSPQETLDSESAAAAEGSRPASTPQINLAWHLNSTSLAPRLNNTGINAPEAWALGSRGEGITVAVVDTLLQWDHPALANNIYQLPAGVPGLPGESRGWDFVENDPNTRMEARELTQLGPAFRSTFTLADTALLDRYRPWANTLRHNNPNDSDAQIANHIRNAIRYQVVNEFHGTLVAGVIGARSPEPSGLMGVAPEVKILPIRAGELGGGFSMAPAVEAIGYAAARGADVINLSWGRMMPVTAIADAITDALETNPRLILVAAAGNDGENRVGFPAGLRHVISVGASTLQGSRAPYSSYGPGLTLVAPGGNLRDGQQGGILSTTGTGNDPFWQDIPLPSQPWFPAQDAGGEYAWTEGTSFASPAVAGVVALMLSADSGGQLSRDQVIALLEATANPAPLQLQPEERSLYRLLRDQSATPPEETEFQYFFGSGLVNAEEAVRLVQARGSGNSG